MFRQIGLQPTNSNFKRRPGSAQPSLNILENGRTIAVSGLCFTILPPHAAHIHMTVKQAPLYEVNVCTVVSIAKRKAQSNEMYNNEVWPTPGKGSIYCQISFWS